MPLQRIDEITAKLDALLQRLRAVPTHFAPLGECSGRFLAEPVRAFRDSPAVDVSAMDGYAFRMEDAPRGTLPVSGIASAGAAPLKCIAGHAIRIFTGGAVPDGADCVVPREWCTELQDRVDLSKAMKSLRPGLNIRRRGENGSRGTVVLEPGTLLNAPAISALVSLSESVSVSVFEPVRIAILNTGDELFEPDTSIQDWQIRDSNGPFLASMLANCSWARTTRAKVPDDPEQIRLAISKSLEHADAVLVTGGVSMGDTDYVPQGVVHCGGEVIFHRIPIRPGKPLLGAVGPQGQLVLGMPGNPVSVAVTFRRYALPLLCSMAGATFANETVVRVPVHCDDPKTLELLWFRLVKLDGSGTATLLSNQGSGDIIALAKSDGFVEIPPGVESKGSFPFYPWTTGVGFT
jgi:molybdopterin molybdotransferase